MGYHSPQLGSVSLHFGKTVISTQAKECFHSDHESRKVVNEKQLSKHSIISSSLWPLLSLGCSHCPLSLYCTYPLLSLLWRAVTLVPSHWHSAQLPRVFSFLPSLGTSGLFFGLEMDNILYPCCHSQSLVPSGTVWVSMCAFPLIRGSLFSPLRPFLMELLVSCRELKFLLQLLKLRLGNWWGL